MVKVAINGYGRIGRNICRALYESEYRDRIQIVAINDLGDTATNAHLTQYDTAHGRFQHPVSVTKAGHLSICDDEIVVLQERDPERLPWEQMDSAARSSFCDC